MRTEKPWLESDLTLADLRRARGALPAQPVAVAERESSARASSTTSTRSGSRVKRCLADPAYDSQTILDIALAAGFSSKTAFNAALPPARVDYRPCPGVPAASARTRSSGDAVGLKKMRAAPGG